MKIHKAIVGLGYVSPRFDVREYVKGHIENGATEFFCGYNSKEWFSKFGHSVSSNGRFGEFENIKSKEDLEIMIDEVHNHNKLIFANVNAWYYTDITEKYIRDIVDDYINSGIDGFICGSAGILEYLTYELSDWSVINGKTVHGKEVKNYSNEEAFKGTAGEDNFIVVRGKKLRLNISTILAVYNKQAIKFLAEQYPINKIILSREVTLAEIKDITKEFPRMAFEVFGEGDFCRYNNGNCQINEHKIVDRDLCIIVVKTGFEKRKAVDFKFRETILSKDEDAINKIYGEFKGIQDIIIDGEDITENLIKKAYRYRPNMTFDWLLDMKERENQFTYGVYKALKTLEKTSFVEEKLAEFEEQIKKGLEFQKSLGSNKFVRMKTYKDKFYNRGDNLNLFFYKEISKLPNVDTIKFPTRGRSFADKIKLVNKVGKMSEDEIKAGIGMGSTLEKCNVDISQLFTEKDFLTKMRNYLPASGEEKE